MQDTLQWQWWAVVPVLLFPLIARLRAATGGTVDRTVAGWVLPLPRGDTAGTRAGTVVGWNGGVPVLTPHDDCVLVMPTLVHAVPGATLVRFGRFRAASATPPAASRAGPRPPRR